MRRVRGGARPLRPPHGPAAAAQNPRLQSRRRRRVPVLRRRRTSGRGGGVWRRSGPAGPCHHRNGGRLCRHRARNCIVAAALPGNGHDHAPRGQPRRTRAAIHPTHDVRSGCSFGNGDNRRMAAGARDRRARRRHIARLRGWRTMGRAPCAFDHADRSRDRRRDPGRHAANRGPARLYSRRSGRRRSASRSAPMGCRP